MGLDQYLTAQRYVSEHSERDTELLEVMSKLPIPKGIGRVKTIKADVMYWRKANAIHEWFVKNVQDGEDDCREYWVSFTALMELLAVCKEVYADHSKAEDLLPTQEGFFFGTTDYDEWYYENLKETIARLEELKTLSEEDLSGWDFFYQSSW